MSGVPSRQRDGGQGFVPRAGGEGEAGERGGRVEAANAYFLAGKESGEQN